MRYRFDGPEGAEPRLVLAHGAGAGMDSDFMEQIAGLIAAHGIRVVRFEFPYMAAARASGTKKPPDRESRLIEAWREVIADLGGGERLVIGGKSMGGRIASMVADDVGVRGLVALGYPFHPAGRPDRLRIEHLQALRTPALFLQGERDALGKREEVESYPLATGIAVHWLADGDHSFKPRKVSGHTQAEHLESAADAVARFVQERSR